MCSSDLDISAKYGIQVVTNDVGNVPEKKNQVRVQSLLVTSDCIQNIYTQERKLVQRQPYYLYIAAESNNQIENVAIRFLRPEFQFLPGSGLLNSPTCFTLASGPSGYKFCFMAQGLYQGKVLLSLCFNDQVLVQMELPEISVVEPHNQLLAYAQQDKCLAELRNFIAGTGGKNQLAVISGRGASGKSYLMDILLRDLSIQYETVSEKV